MSFPAYLFATHGPFQARLRLPAKMHRGASAWGAQAQISLIILNTMQFITFVSRLVRANDMEPLRARLCAHGRSYATIRHDTTGMVRLEIRNQSATFSGRNLGCFVSRMRTCEPTFISSGWLAIAHSIGDLSYLMGVIKPRLWSTTDDRCVPLRRPHTQDG